MGRPKLQIPRDHQLNVALTASEFADVLRASRLAGMRPVDYARAKILVKTIRQARVAETIRPVDTALLVHLSRVGNNLNQIARRLNELALPLPDDLEPLLSEIRLILRSVPAP